MPLEGGSLIQVGSRVYRKIPKISPGLLFSKALFEGLIFGGAYIQRDLSTEGNLSFKIDWASLIAGSKLTVLDWFYFVFEAVFQVQAPGGLIFGGAIQRRDFALPVWGAYIWRGLFSEFYGIMLSRFA